MSLVSGTIYAIVNDMDSRVYVGSTRKTIKQRFTKHIISSRQPKPNHKLHCHMALLGAQHFSVFSLTSFNDVPREQRYKLEGLAIRKMKADLNTRMAGRTQKENDSLPEKLMHNKQRDAVYHLANKIVRNATSQAYRIQNKEKVAAAQKVYRRVNAEAIAQQRHEKRERDRANNVRCEVKYVKYDCECGGRYTHMNIIAHRKTGKHLKHLSSKD
jgi:hypothetical protein